MKKCTPQSIVYGTVPITTDIVMMPQQGTDYTLHGKKLPAQGYATYAIKFLLLNNAIHGVYLDHMTSAYQMFIKELK